MRAARCILVWLQAFTALLVWISTLSASSWLPQTCDWLKHISMDSVGLCGCRGASDEQECWTEQLVYRGEVSLVVVLLLLVLLTASGCGDAAAKLHTAGKFVGLLILGVVCMFLPNSVFSVFGSVASCASAIYLIAQAILLIDFGYSWNELWHGHAIKAEREVSHRPQGRRDASGWKIAIVVASAALLLGSLVGTIYLCATYPGGGARALVLVAELVSLALLCISITDWCKHGALLPSSLMAAYIMWLAYSALSLLPREQSEATRETPLLPSWVGLVICAVSLASFSQSTGLGHTPEQPRLQAREGLGLVAPAEDAEAAGAGATAEANSGVIAAVEEEEDRGFEPIGFIVQCLVHAAAAVYIASVLAPSKGDFTYGCNAAAVFIALALFAWTLVAPMVLTNRSFS